MENETPPKEPNKNIGHFGSLLIGAGVTALLSMSTELLSSMVHMLGEAAQSQVAQAGFFFTIASLIHSGRMKKEIRANFEGLNNAIDRVSFALREDLQKHGERLDKLSDRVDKLETKTITTRPEITQ